MHVHGKEIDSSAMFEKGIVKTETDDEDTATELVGTVKAATKKCISGP